MKLFYTRQALASLQEVLDFFPPEVPPEKVNEIRDQILAKTSVLLINPNVGQREEYLEHLGQSHRYRNFSLHESLLSCLNELKM